MDLKAVEKAARKIQASLFKNSNSYSIGMLKSHFRGTGLQFKEHQIYSHGDDVRFIDWRLLAKTTVPYVKTFEEERNVDIVVVLDASASMLIGHNNVSKLQASIEIICLLYLLAHETKDKVQLILLGEEISVLPKKSGMEGVISLIALLEKKGIMNSEGKVNLKYRPNVTTTEQERSKAITTHLLRKKEVIIFSDFNDFLSIETLKNILFRANLHCFQVLSPLDEADELPYSVYSYDSHMMKCRGKLIKIKSKTNDELDKMLGKKFKKLRVQNRYLEEFIKEML